MHMVGQLREYRLNQGSKRIDHITLERCLMLLIGAFGCQQVHALLFLETLSTFLVNKALVGKDQAVSQVRYERRLKMDR